VGRGRCCSLRPVEFRITPHSGFQAPEDALELLWSRLGTSHDQVSFAKDGPEITAVTGDDAPVSMTRDERVEIGRRAILNVVRAVCEQVPELESDWFAVSSER
jgi:hypothetical protein